MHVLFVASYNSGHFAPFVMEQAQALQRLGCEVDFFAVIGKGPLGYLRNLHDLKVITRAFQAELIHAHYGLSGLLATLQHIVPVVVTYHGSDLNEPLVRPFSQLAMRRADWNIRVFGPEAKRPNETLLPCGIDLPTGKEQLPPDVLQPGRKHILFAGAFDNPVKDAALAKQAVAPVADAQLIELRGFTREQVYALMQACDALLLTSRSEGSPQVIKEAMACGLPIVTTNVGDVALRLQNLDGCFIANSRNPQEITDLLHKSLDFNGKTDGRQRLIDQGLTNDRVAAQLLNIYQQVLAK